MYRAATYVALSNDLDDDFAQIIAILKENPISFGTSSEGQLVYVGEVDVTHAIRQNDVTNAVLRFQLFLKFESPLLMHSVRLQVTVVSSWTVATSEQLSCQMPI